MVHKDSFAIGFVMGIIFVSTIISGIEYWKQDHKETNKQITETTLTDGTRCAVNRNGGIACNWRDNK